MNTFETQYKKIVSGISTLPYIGQLERIKSVSENRPVILYGAGKAVGIISHICRLNNLDITLICDSNRRGKYKKACLSVPIISPQELIEKYPDSTVIVTSWKFEKEIRENLQSIGFNDDNIFSFYYPQRITPEIFEEDYYDGYKWAYHFYKDEKSKQLIINKIKSYLASEPLKPDTTDNEFLDSAITLGENEVALYCTHNPDGSIEIKTFLDKVGEKYEHIYMVTPENESFLKLQEYVRNHNDIKVFNAGLGADDCVKTFYCDGYMASGFVSCMYFSATGLAFNECCLKKSCFKIEERNVFSIDTMISDGRISHIPTFICLDVQGSEADALLGAATLIREHKPKLAICAYHQVQDIYELPKTLLTIRADYKFALRQHDFGYYETVLYAY